MARAETVAVAIPPKVAEVVGQRVDGVDADEPEGDLLRVAVEAIEVAENLGVGRALRCRELFPNTALDKMAVRVLARVAKWTRSVPSSTRCGWPCRVAEEDCRRREARGRFGSQRSDVADSRCRRPVGQPGFQCEAESPSVGDDGRVRHPAQPGVDLFLEVGGGQRQRVSGIVAFGDEAFGQVHQDVPARAAQEVGGQRVGA